MIGGFQSDLLITCKVDGNFWKRFHGCFVFKSRVLMKTVVSSVQKGFPPLKTSCPPVVSETPDMENMLLMGPVKYSFVFFPTQW